MVDAQGVVVDLEVLRRWAQRGERRMVLGVVADHESVADLVTQAGGEVVDLLADDEEGGGDVEADELTQNSGV